MKDQHGNEFELRGLLWQPKTDGVRFSVEINGELFHAEIHELEAGVREYARVRGWEIGKACDVINHSLRVEEERRNPPFATFTFALTGEQSKQLQSMFFPDHEPTSAAQETDKIDGSAE